LKKQGSRARGAAPEKVEKRKDCGLKGKLHTVNFRLGLEKGKKSCTHLRPGEAAQEFTRPNKSKPAGGVLLFSERRNSPADWNQ